MIPLSDVPFATLRRLLRDLGFREGTTPEGHHVFEHEPSGALFVFRAYKPQDRVSVPDMISVRTQFDYRGLLSPEALERRLKKASA
jgi:hypothetical protein